MSESNSASDKQEHQTGILGMIERAGNKLPDPAFIFFYLIIVMVIVSALAAWAGISAEHPVSVDDAGNPVVLNAASALAPDNIQSMLVNMPSIFTGFYPLGFVLVVMLGAGVAERAGLFGSALRAAVRNAPKFLLTPVVALSAMMGNLAADAAYVVLIPLAGVLYAAAGRHPVAGITAAFAGVSGGFSANLLPGQLDALLFGLTQAAAQTAEPTWTMNITGNWYFIAAMTILYLPIIWYVTDRIIEKRLGPWTGGAVAGSDNSDDDPNAPLTAGQKKGLVNAGFAVLAVSFVWLLMTVDLVELVSFGSISLWNGNAPLFNEAAMLLPDGSPNPEASVAVALSPFFGSLVAGFMILFVFAGLAYGKAAGTISTHRDVVEMMTGAMKDMGYYLVLSFFAAYFVLLFNISNLGLISAIHGANAIEQSGLPTWILIGIIVIFAGILNLFVGSASAKWGLLAPVLVPMLMFVGLSPEMATAAYRVGDSATNIITPLMVYFPLVLVFARRWVPEFGIGSLTASMIPYSLYLLIGGMIMAMGWVFLDLPLGPGATVGYTLPGAG